MPDEPRPDAAGIARVYAHSQSLAQCHEWLNQHLPHAERVAVVSNAEAARLASQEEGAAAVGGRAAAALYALNLLAENIEDNPNNTTRFVGDRPSGRAAIRPGQDLAGDVRAQSSRGPCTICWSRWPSTA